MDDLRQWLHLAGEASVRHRALRVAVVVGTLLAAINHGDRLMAGALDRSGWLRVLLTYLVPYCVSTWASVQAIRRIENDAAGERI